MIRYHKITIGVDIVVVILSSWSILWVLNNKYKSRGRWPTVATRPPKRDKKGSKCCHYRVTFFTLYGVYSRWCAN